MNTANRLSAALLLGSTALAALIMPAPARADDCLLDRDDDGNVDLLNVDNDGGADSNDDDASLACGVGAEATGQFATALGSNALASGDRTVAVGRIAQATAADATALGQNARAQSISSIALGQASFANGVSAIAIGGDGVDMGSSGAQANGDGAVALGADAFAGEDRALALGGNALASGLGSVALGANSVSDRGNAVSVGDASTSLTRQIINVAAGTQETDAVNLGQLNNAVAGVANPFVAVNSFGQTANANGFDAIAVGRGVIPPEAVPSRSGALLPRRRIRRLQSETMRRPQRLARLR